MGYSYFCVPIVMQWIGRRNGVTPRDVFFFPGGFVYWRTKKSMEHRIPESCEELCYIAENYKKSISCPLSSSPIVR